MPSRLDLPNEFPQELLKAPINERVKFFTTRLVPHPHFRNTLKELLLEIEVAEPNTVIFVIGPPGVGKSTLKDALEYELLELYRKEMEADPGLIPVCGIQAREGPSQKFSWRDYRFRFLQKLDPVGLDRKLPMPLDKWRETHKSMLPTVRSLGHGDLSYAFERAVQNRKVKVLLVDDADAIAKASSGRKQLSQLEVTKSDADIVEVPHVMFGTYDLWKFRTGISNHLTRRTVDIHFARYRAEQRQDLPQFVQVVRALARLLPVHESPNLDSCIDFLYARTIGCVGSLKILLNKALRHALSEGLETITQAELERHALPAGKCLSLINEARAIEEEMEETPEEKSAELRNKLGLKAVASKSPKNPAQTSGNGHHRPGVRAPHRDPIG